MHVYMCAHHVENFTTTKVNHQLFVGMAQKKLREALRLKFGKKGQGLNTGEDPDHEYKDDGDQSDNDTRDRKGGKGRGRARGRGKGRGRGRGRGEEKSLRKPPTVGPGGFDDELEEPSPAGGDLDVLEEKAKAAEAKAYQDMEDTAREKREGEDESDVETPRKCLV